MKKFTLLLLLCLAISVVAAIPEGSFVGVRPFGAGAIFGEPTALSAKWNMSSANALAFHLGWSLGMNGINGGVDFLLHQPWLALPWRPYLGIGGRLGVWDNNKFKDDYPDATNFHLAGRGLVGVEYLFLGGQLGAAAELGLGLTILPGIGLDLSGGIAIRYYF